MDLPEKAKVNGLAMLVGFCSRRDSALDDEDAAATGSARRAVAAADYPASPRPLSRMMRARRLPARFHGKGP
jgi:hypothetical protein